MNHILYSNYNSIISEGHRVRRMRRTQLSAQKIINLNNNQCPNFQSRQISTRKAKSCRSLPKVQKSMYIYHKQKCNPHEKIDDIHNEYYKKGKEKGTQIIKEEIQANFYRHASMRQPKNQYFRSSSLPQNKSHSKVIQEYSAVSSNSKLSQSNQRISKIIEIRNRLEKSRLSKKSTHSKNSKLSSFRSSKKDSQNNYDENYGIKNQTKKISSQKKKKQSINISKSKQLQSSRLNVQSQKSKISQQQSQMNEDTYQMRKQFRNEQNFILDQPSLKEKQVYKEKKIKKKIQPESRKSSFKESFLSNSNFQTSKISNIQLGDSQSDPIDENLNSSQFSKLEDEKDSVIKVINGSKSLAMKKKNDSFSDAVGSLASVSILHEKKNSFMKKDNKRQVIPTLNKKISLKLQSLARSDYGTNDFNYSHNDKMRNSFKNLPLTSREPSQRKSLGESRAKPMGNTLEEVIERIEIHDFIITLLSDFGQQTLQFYSREGEKYERVCYLLERKHFLQKNNMIKALRGGKNIFKMSSIQIPSEILNLYLQHPEIQNLIKQHEESNRTLFKKLRKQYNDIRANHKNDPSIKLETPVDNFSNYLVNDLHKQLQELYPSLDDDYLSEELLQKYQDRIIEIMEKIFVISEFAGRKVKKLQFAEEIQDFYTYYEDNFANLIATIEFFQQMQ